MTATVTHPATAAARAAPAAIRRTRAWSLPEVRWAATALFAAGLAAHFAGGPGWLPWTLFLACYVTGGWEPGWAGLRALWGKTLDVDLLMVSPPSAPRRSGKSWTAGS